MLRGPSFTWELAEESSLDDLDDEDEVERLPLRYHHLPWTPTTELRAVISARTIGGGSLPPEEHLMWGRTHGRELARRAGYQLIAMIDDWTVEEHLDRPGLNALRLLIQARLVDVVVIIHWSTLALDQATALQLRQEFLNAGCEVRTILGGLPKEELC